MGWEISTNEDVRIMDRINVVYLFAEFTQALKVKNVYADIWKFGFVYETCTTDYLNVWKV